MIEDLEIAWEKFLNDELTTEEVLAYLLAKYRIYLYNNQDSSLNQFLLRTHIHEQFEYRLRVMSRKCYENGSCLECGCKTPDLQFSPLPCDGDCYPKLMSRKEWESYVPRETN